MDAEEHRTLPPSRHVIVMGPGRCGTSAFVRLLHNLGQETGYLDEEVNRDWGRKGAGLEWPIRGVKSVYPMPYIIKSPALSLDIPERMERWNWIIDHAYILVRDVDKIVNSRFERTRGRGYTATLNELEEQKVNAFLKTGGALLNCLKLNISYTIIEHPKWTLNKEYCRSKLHWEPTKEEFDIAFNKSIDISKIR